MRDVGYYAPIDIPHATCSFMLFRRKARARRVSFCASRLRNGNLGRVGKERGDDVDSIDDELDSPKQDSVAKNVVSGREYNSVIVRELPGFTRHGKHPQFVPTSLSRRW